MLTARTAADDRIVGLEAGADDYLTKPFSPRELVLRAQSVLRRTLAEARPEGPVVCGGYPYVSCQAARAGSGRRGW
tara:strand:- start:275 stop:502 length:228 start_codon:yes stop_codon:yes gene_type:complete